MDDFVKMKITWMKGNRIKSQNNAEYREKSSSSTKS
jgi:hypothetical protein